MKPVTSAIATLSLLTNFAVAQAGTIQYRSRGFTADIPASWQVRSTKFDGFVATGPGGAIFVAERFENKKTTTSRVVDGMPKWHGELFPNMKLGGRNIVQSPDSHQTSTPFEFGSSERPGLGALMAKQNPRTGNGFATVFGSDAQNYPVVKRQLLAIARSLHVGYHNEGPRRVPDDSRNSGDQGFVRFTDPKEAAFACEVPRGWRVSGGLERRSRFELRPVVRLTSPDGAIDIRLGDSRIPTFVEAQSQGAWQGQAKGGEEWREVDRGTRALIRPYVPGQEFAEQYARNMFGQIEVTQKAEMGKLGRDMQRTLNGAMGGGRVAMAAGLATFKVGRRVGLAFSATTRYRQGVWVAGGNLAIVSPLDRATEARRVLIHVLRTTTFAAKTWGGGEQGRKTVELNKRMNMLLAQALEELTERRNSRRPQRSATEDVVEAGAEGRSSRW